MIFFLFQSGKPKSSKQEAFALFSHGTFSFIPANEQKSR